MVNIETDITEALHEAHVVLLEDLRTLEESVGPASAQGLAQLRARLGRVYAHVTEHFRFEEQDGYMRAVRRRQPRLERTILQLAAEHRQLTESLNALIDKAWAAASLDDPFQAEVRDWVERVRQHEARENDLIQGAYNLDIGTED